MQCPEKINLRAASNAWEKMRRIVNGKSDDSEKGQTWRIDGLYLIP
jgi:hypothetical protein